MKITRLDLRAYGPFTDVALDFPDVGPGLHLIHGPNEAGKSSAMRAIKALLFKFPHATPDDHVHKYANLRVGATLNGTDGGPFSILRRKAVKSLWDASDAKEIAEGELERRLGGMTESRFCSIFQSTLDDLKQGGKDLIEGKGDFGEVLFSGSGLSRLPEIRRRLEEEAEALFKGAKAAKNPRINAALLELDTARKTAQDKAIPPAQWASTDLESKELVAERAEARRELDRAEAEYRRLERIGQAIPLLADRREAMARLAEIGEVAMLPDGFTERRLNAIAARDANEQSAAIARAAVEAIEAELAAIIVPDRLLDEAAAIGKIRDELGVHRKARAGRPKLVERAEQFEAAARSALVELAPGRSLDEADSLRIGKAHKSAIQSIGLERSAIESTVKSARDEVRALAEALADRSLPEGPEAHRKRDGLAALVDRLGKSTDPQTLVETARAEVRKAETESDVALARLPRWSGTLDRLAGLPVPSEATSTELDRLVAEAQADLKAAEKAVRAKVAEINQLDEEAAQAGTEPPTEADLKQVRDRRDEHWQEVRRAWIKTESTRPPSDLARDYEHLVGSSDQIADELRRESDRVSAHLIRVTRRTRLVEESKGLEEVRAKAVETLDRAKADREASWRPAGIAPGTPAEMKAWSTQYRDLIARAAAIREKRLEVDRLVDRLTSVRKELGAALIGPGEHGSTDAESLATMLDRARSLLDLIERGDDLRSARGRLASAELKLAEWMSRWAEAVGRLGLKADASPTLAIDVLERLDGFFGTLEKARKHRSDLADQDAETSAYENLVSELARRVDLTTEADSAEAIAEALVSGLADAERARDRRKAAQARHKAETTRRTSAESAIRDQTAMLAALCQEAGCESADDLPEIERRSTEAGRLRERIEDSDRHILKLGAGAGLAEIARQAESIVVDELPARLRDLTDHISELKTRVDELNEQVGRIGEILKRMDGSAEASDANAKGQQVLAQIEGDVEQYVRLKLASAVLRKAIDRYRDEHQGPILKRLGGLFAELTVGSFADVTLDDEANGKSVLKGVRPGPQGGHVAIEGMSLGTADALYLAVRLATLEMYLDSHEPMPFIVDDILIQFDDGRASAALGALARLSERTQVFFFTHHRHLIDLAERSLPQGAWRLHELSRRPELALTAP